MIRLFRKYHLAQNFRDYKAKVLWEMTVKDKSKIDGAYLLIKRFKSQLKQFYSALETIFKSRANRDDLEALKSKFQ
jgi:hypothetical protein